MHELMTHYQFCLHRSQTISFVKLQKSQTISLVKLQQVARVTMVNGWQHQLFILFLCNSYHTLGNNLTHRNLALNDIHDQTGILVGVHIDHVSQGAICYGRAEHRNVVLRVLQKEACDTLRQQGCDIMGSRK